MRVDEHTIYLDESPVFYRTAAPPVPAPSKPPVPAGSPSESPAGSAPALYLHGIPTSSDDFVEFLARTGGIAPDLQGFGRSGKGGHLDYSLAGLTRFLERFLVDIQVETVKLVAHDWGAAVALMLAERHPHRVETLVLFNPPPVFAKGVAWPRPIRLWRTRLVGEGLMGSTNRWLLARTLRQGSVRDEAWPDARVDEVWDQFDQGTQRAILRLVRSAREDMFGGSGAAAPTGLDAPGDPGDLDAPGDPDTTGATDIPALIIWGDLDPWYPPSVADAYAARLPGAKVERLPDAGHWPWLDRPDLVDRVADFLVE